MIIEDAQMCARAIALMVYHIAPKVKQKGYIAQEICQISSPRDLAKKIDSAVLVRIFESQKCRKFLEKTCPGVAMSVFFRFRGSKIAGGYEIAFTREGIQARAVDKRPLADKISEIQNSLIKNNVQYNDSDVSSVAVKATRLEIYCYDCYNLFYFYSKAAELSQRE